jgi:hypothetical protein
MFCPRSSTAFRDPHETCSDMNPRSVVCMYVYTYLGEPEYGCLGGHMKWNGDEMLTKFWRCVVLDIAVG